MKTYKINIFKHETKKIDGKRKTKKTILEKKKRFVFYFQTSNLYLIKQKYKSFLKLFSLQNILEKL
jgi:hypothetical protein